MNFFYLFSRSNFFPLTKVPLPRFCIPPHCKEFFCIPPLMTTFREVLIFLPLEETELFFCLFETLWRAAQKLIFPLFWKIAQEINEYHFNLNTALLPSQHFLVVHLLCFCYSKLLGSLGTFTPCYQLQLNCVDFSLLKT